MTKAVKKTEVTKLEEGSVQIFKLKPQLFEAIQFTGKNGKDVVAFAKEHGMDARNGGTYVHFFGPSDKITVRKGEFLVAWYAVKGDKSESPAMFCSNSDFHRDFSVTKAHGVF